MKCCICGKEIVGYGNNAWPYAKGTCCDKCNDDEVIPLRILNSEVNEAVKRIFKKKITIKTEN